MHVLTGLGAGVGGLSSLLVPIDGAYLHANKSLLIHFPFLTSENQRALKRKKQTNSREWRGLSKGPDRNVLSEDCSQPWHTPQAQTEPYQGAARELGSIPANYGCSLNWVLAAK